MTKERFHNKAEEYVNFVNDNMFLKEFTYSDNEIKIDDGEIELADNIVWVDNFLFLIQIKQRRSSHVSRQQLCQAFAAFISGLFLRKNKSCKAKGGSLHISSDDYHRIESVIL